MARLAEAIAAQVAEQSRGPRCGVAALRQKLGGEDLVDFNAALEDRDLPASVIARELGILLGYRVTAYPLQRHRRGECGCSR